MSVTEEERDKLTFGCRHSATDMVRLTRFLNRLRQFDDERQAQRRSILERGLQTIAARLPRFVKEAQSYEAKFSPGFNVYRILRLERREVLVHTPMLAQLLDPMGTHGQGFLFLKAFLSLLENSGFNLPEAKLERFQWFVETEKPTGTHGNLDILVSCAELSCVVVIENKIGAKERRDQMWDYSRWLERKGQFLHKCLVFLTPDGREAKTANGADCVRLSYHTDIFRWLSDLLPHIGSPTVKETIRQYLRVIENC